MTGSNNPRSNTDRTVYDPLDADALRSIREAREQAKRAALDSRDTEPPRSPKKPDDEANKKADPEVGKATIQRAPAPELLVESMGGNRTLLREQPVKVDPITDAGATIPATAVPEAILEEMGMQTMARRADEPAPAEAPPPLRPQAPEPPGMRATEQAPDFQPPGFGSNTQMWMNAVSVPPKAVQVSVPPLPKPEPKKKAITSGLFVLAGATAVGVAALLFGGGGKPSAVELITTPAKATVKINGNETTGVKTPMKLMLKPGTHEVELSLKGYRPETITIEVRSGAEPVRKEVSLYPISQQGLMTLSVSVHPVAGSITIDGERLKVSKVVRLRDVDPTTPHTIAVEAGGYQKVEKKIDAGELQESYEFDLEPLADEEG